MSSHANAPTAEAAVVWVDVYDDDALWDGEMVGVVAGTQKVVLARVGGDVVAYWDVCPHKGTPLSDGDLDGDTIVCGVHLWEFDALTGTSINPVGSRLSCVPVRVRDGRIEVGVTQP